MHSKNSSNKLDANLISIVGYGTFITHGYWKDKLNVEVCTVNNFVRIFPKGNWFPYALLLKNSSFRALKFCISKEELEELDVYEGVSTALFNRIETEIILKNNRMTKAFIYVPTENTIISQNLTPKIDKNDKWREEIKKIHEIVEKFPELIL